MDFSGYHLFTKETELYDYDVYTIEGFTIAPVFCYEDLDNVIVPKERDDHSVPYELVKDNEVFMETEELEKEYYDFKYRIISKFDEEYRKSHE